MGEPAKRPGLGRRGLLLGLAAGVLGGPLSRGAWAFGRGEHRVLELYDSTTKERYEDAYWSNGRYVPAAFEALSRFLRDCHDHCTCRIDPALAELMHALQASLGGSELVVICGYRSPASNARARRQRRGVARNSYHLQGRAVDIRVPEFELHEVRQLAMGLERGGVGYYRRANYLHLDTGPVRHWGR